MGNKLDDAKGRTKRAVGDLTDDNSLKNEGRADQIGARVKGATDAARNKIDHLVDAAKERR